VKEAEAEAAAAAAAAASSATANDATTKPSSATDSLTTFWQSSYE